MEIKSYHFTLQAAAEVDNLVSELVEVADTHVYIHIAAFMHNTVMIHNLISLLEKKLPEPTIIQLPQARNEDTVVSLFTYSQAVHEQIEEDELPLGDLILNYIHQENIKITNEVTYAKRELIKRYLTDTLTSLPNLYQLREDLHDDADITLIYLNVDNFKIINDFYGYVVGDYILEELAKQLTLQRENGKVYRISGSQFALTENASFDFYTLKSYMEELVANFKHLSFMYNKSQIFVDLTYASIPTAHTDELFSKVSMALQYARDKHQDFWIYEERLKLKKLYEHNIKTSLNIRTAITNSGIVPYFQPIVDNKTDKISKYESLSRLVDTEGNILEPEAFLAIAKTIKIYKEVTKTIINKTFDAFRDNEHEFSINLSIEDIMDEEITSFITKKLQESDRSNQVIFEILESSHIDDFEKIARFITEIKRYGAKISIDDFGSGYSNFSYLANLQVDYLKIDGSLIQNIDKDETAVVIVETIVDFAKKLNIKTIAEHVHSSTILDKVKLLGIDYSQGFLIDKPQPYFKED
jgi:c-di-GMP phosphodiesterase